METTAEGIESFDQLDLIRNLRVSHVQGYIYSKAVHRGEIARRLETGNWSIAPSGPARQRSERQSMYRKAGAILGGHYRPVMVRNLSETGALIDGLIEVPIGTQFIMDFGDGQLVGATTRRISKRQTGIEFGMPLVSDGNGGLCTSHRVAPNLLGTVGLSATRPTDMTQIWDEMNAPTIEQLAEKLGIRLMAPVQASAVSQIPGTTAGASHGRDHRHAIPTVEQFAQRYLDHLDGRRRTRGIHDECLRSHILPQFGRFRLDEIAHSDIASWLTATSRQDGLATADRLRAVMGYMFVMAKRWSVPGADVSPIQLRSLTGAGNEREPVLTAHDIVRLRKAAQASHNPHLGFIVSLLLLTRLRVRELLTAQWEDIDLENRIWRVASANSETTLDIPLTAAAMEIICQLPRWNDCPHVIANPRTRRPYRSIFRSWDAARKRAGIADVSIHDLRYCAP